MDTVCKNGLQQGANIALSIGFSVIGGIGAITFMFGLDAGLALGSLAITVSALSVVMSLMLIIIGSIIFISGFALMIYFLHQSLSESEPLKGVALEDASQLERYNNTIGRVFLEAGITIEYLPTDAYVTGLVEEKEYLNFSFSDLAEMEYPIYQGTIEEIYNNSVYDRPFILVRFSDAVVIYQQRYIDEKYEWNINIIREDGVLCQNNLTYEQCFFLKEAIGAYIRLSL